MPCQGRMQSWTGSIFSLPVGRLQVLLCFLFRHSRSREFPWIAFPSGAGFLCPNQAAQQSLTPGCLQVPQKETAAALVAEPRTACAVPSAWARDPRREAVSVDRQDREDGCRWLEGGWKRLPGGNEAQAEFGRWTGVR